jgi:hypothetical protein
VKSHMASRSVVGLQGALYVVQNGRKRYFVANEGKWGKEVKLKSSRQCERRKLTRSGKKLKI